MQMQACRVFWCAKSTISIVLKRELADCTPKIDLGGSIHPVRMLPVSGKDVRNLRFGLVYGPKRKRVRFRAPDVATYDNWEMVLEVAVEKAAAERPNSPHGYTSEEFGFSDGDGSDESKTHDLRYRPPQAAQNPMTGSFKNSSDEDDTEDDYDRIPSTESEYEMAIMPLAREVEVTRPKLPSSGNYPYARSSDHAWAHGFLRHGRGYSLLRDLAATDASPRCDPELASYPVAVNSGDSNSTRRSLQTTELELNVDKISFLFSPSARPGYGSPNNYKSFADVPLNGSVQDDDELNMLDPYFDVTPPRLRVAFEGAAPEGGGDLSYDGFRVALETLGIRCSDDSVFLKLVQSIDREQSGQITLQQFDAAVHRLKLMHMFDEGTVQEMRTENLHEFFTAHRPEWVNVRWINLDGRDSLNLKRLAIKYRLHPLAIEDTIEAMNDPSLIDMMAICSLCFHVVYSTQTPRDIPADFCQANVVPPQYECSTDDTEEDDEEPLKLWIEHVFIFVVDNDTVITVKDGGETDIWTELNRRLAVPYSKLRHNDAKFLVYSVLDVIVDQVTSVVDSITECLIALENQLEQERHRFELRSLRVLKNELFRLPRLLKPAREVLKNIIESKDFDATQLQMCRQLTEEYRDAKANQMNYVIYTLTVVTTVFLPRYGYALFWVFAIAIAAALQLYFRYKQWI
ncbi:EF-hand domain pair [Phytophthora cactorum]|nr:EF-hand domain pair [Phytophthora cactorum]